MQSSVPPDIAVDAATAVDDRMKKVIRRLHPSATDPGGEWHEGVDGITRPGLVLWSRDDPLAAVRFAERLARRVNAELPSLRQLRSLVASAATGRGRASTGAILGDADVMRIARDYRLRLGG